MTTIPYLYRRLRGLGVPESLATKFADTESTLQGVAVTDLAGSENLAQTQTKINALLASLRAAGLSEE